MASLGLDKTQISPVLGELSCSTVGNRRLSVVGAIHKDYVGELNDSLIYIYWLWV